MNSINEKKLILAIQKKSMLTKKTIIFLMLLTSLLLNFAQAQERFHTLSNDVPTIQYLNILKTGHLLVRLSDRAVIREKLVQYNDSNHLKKFDALLAQEHEEIISAFRNYYNFGEVLFFYRSETQALLDNQWARMTIINHKNEKINSNNIQLNAFMIGEFAKMERKDSLQVKYANEALKKEPKTAFSAFVLRDRNMAILHKDLNLHVRTIFRKNKKVVGLFNSKLHTIFSLISN